MKKALSCVVAACILLSSLSGICFAAAAYQPTISAEGGNVGDTMTVSVSLPANSGAAGGSFNLVYDNTKLELVDAAAGDAVTPNNPTVNTNYENKIRINFASLNALPEDGGVALTATFKAIASGSAEFSTESFKLADTDAKYLTCSDASKSITIVNPDEKIYRPTVSVKGSSDVNVKVSLQPGTIAAGGSFNFVYDNTKLELVDAVAGAAISANNPTVNKTYASNKVRINFASLNPLPEDGGVVLEVTFKAIADGEAVFEVENFKLADVNGNDLICEGITESAIVEVKKLTPTITVDGTSDVEVKVSLPANSGAAGGSFNLVYDNTKLELVDAAAGAAVSANNPTVNTNYENKVRINFAGVNAIPEDGGVVLKASFKAIADGSVVFKTEEFKLADIDGNYLTCADAEVTVNVSEEVVVNKDMTGLTFADATYTYDGTEKKIEVSGNLPSGATVIYESADVEENVATDAGTYNFTATITAPGYNDWTGKATLTINPRPLTVTANNVTKIIGQEDPQLTHQLNGDLVGYDILEVTLQREAGEAVGKYAITAKKIMISDNYEVTFIPGVLEILPIENPDPVPVTGVTLDKTSLTLSEGKSETLTATVLPAAATDKNVTWKSSDEKVATVENGVVTAKSIGKATITVTTVDGGKTATCDVTVTESTETYDVVYSLGKAKGKPGETVEISLSVESDVLVNGILLDNLSYDKDLLEFVEFASYGDLITTSALGANGIDSSKGEISIGYTDPVLPNGQICVLKFNIKENADEKDVVITMDGIASVGGKALSSKLDSGTITISKWLSGDFDSNDKVDMKDVVYFMNWVNFSWTGKYPMVYDGNKDFNLDNSVDMKDVVYFMNWVNFAWTGKYNINW